VSKSRTLRSLHLDANKVGKNLSKLVEAMKQNNTVEELTLKNSEINKKDLLDFFKNHSSDSRLKRLAVEKNELAKSDFDMFTKQFPQLFISFDQKK